MKFNTKELVVQALIASLYVAITMGLYSWSFGDKQIRIAEFLLIFVLINRKHSVGIIIGTLIANLLGPNGMLDAVMGTFATAVVCVLMTLKQPKWMAYLWPSIVNGVFIGVMLNIMYGLPLIVTIISVFISEFVVTFIPFVVIGASITQNEHIRRIFL